jgi:hypothetical protein
MSAPSGVALRLALALGLLVVLRTSRHALADDQVVGDCGDSGGANQLRAKLVAAQSTGGGTITFACPSPIVLDGTVLPTITGDLTIDGGNQITISAGNASRIFVANAGATLTLNNITLTKGFSDADGGAIRNAGTLLINSSRLTDNQTTSPWSGGAIFSTGELNVTNSEFDHNKAGNGGALMLYHSGATATITGSSFHDNETTNATNGWGGAVLLFDGASAKVNASTFHFNLAFNTGGAIYVTSNSSLTMTGSTATINIGSGGDGGAIANYGTTSLTDVTLSGHECSGNGGAIYNNAGDLSLSRVTLDGNKGDASGGGIYTESGVVTLTNVTFSGNATIAGDGGGIFVNGGTATLTNVTFSGNLSDEPGAGGIHKNAGTVTLKNTLLARGDHGQNCAPTFPSMIGGSFGLSDDFSCGFGLGRDVVPLHLGPLANNGGFTKTHLPSLDPLSPAVDNGTVTGAPAGDQRGISRPQGIADDVGAVEVCQVKPAKPALHRPGNNRRANGPRVSLDWNDPICAYTYTVTIRLGSPSGTKVQKKGRLTASSFLTRTLASGETYAWRVTAVNSVGKSKSDWSLFKVK